MCSKSLTIQREKYKLLTLIIHLLVKYRHDDKAIMSYIYYIKDGHVKVTISTVSKEAICVIPIFRSILLLKLTYRMVFA